MKAPIAVQLYSVREETKKDFIGTLEKVAKMGYDGVEFAGYGDIPAKEMKKHLDRLGLKVAGSHLGLDALTNNLDNLIKYNLEIGCKNIGCASASLKNIDEIKEVAKKFQIIGNKCKENGIHFYYHNHAHEFEKINGEYILDLLFSMVDKDNLDMELDTYWVKIGGVDPINYMKKHSDRCTLIHLKDMTTENGEKTYAAIGDGTMDIEEILSTSDKINVKWVIVENDDPKPNGIDNITRSINYLKK